MDQQPPHAQQTSAGLLNGVVNLGRNMLGLVMSRIELAAIEIAEVRSNLLKLMVVFMLGMLVAFFALAYWTVLIVYLSWAAMGWSILLIVAVLCTVATIGIFMYLRTLIQTGKLSLPATMAELRRDHDALL